MLVYRLETAKGVGPYRRDNYYAAMDYADGMGKGDPTHIREMNADTHLTPTAEGFYNQAWTEGHHFGTIDIAGILSWFLRDEWDIEVLTHLGMQITTYEVDEEHVIKGAVQLIFIKGLAKVIEVSTPAEFFIKHKGATND